jgi:uncharacterized membrane protein
MIWFYVLYLVGFSLLLWFIWWAAGKCNDYFEAEAKRNDEAMRIEHERNLRAEIFEGLRKRGSK